VRRLTRTIGLPCREETMTVATRHIHTTPQRSGQADGRTDRRTDRIPISISCISIAVLTRDKNWSTFESYRKNKVVEFYGPQCMYKYHCFF